MSEIILALGLAFIGGAIGASLGALGGFVIFGLLGTVGYLYLIFGESDIWLVSLFSGELFVPSVCFVGGTIATAYTRKLGYIECGKDIGRSLISLRRLPIILVGGIAGVVGFITMSLIAIPFDGKFDTVALTVIAVPLIMKYVWNLRKTNDCEGSSHVLPSPYRFFEKLNGSIGKQWLTIGMAVITAIVTIALLLDSHTEPFAGSMMFFLSAFSLYLLFFKIPIPATHHITGPAGVIVVQWTQTNSLTFTVSGIILPLLWAISIALLSQLGSDLTKRFLFDEGDIHVDPPAGGIVISTAVAMWLLPDLGVFEMSGTVQTVSALAIFAVSIFCSLRFFMSK